MMTTASEYKSYEVLLVSPEFINADLNTKESYGKQFTIDVLAPNETEAIQFVRDLFQIPTDWKVRNIIEK